MTDHDNRDDPRHCHALRVRLDHAVDVEALAGPTRLWVDDVPAPADAPSAVRRRERELSRPVTANQGLRRVLVRYADAHRDLVLVAHRAAYDRSSLRAVAAALLGGPATVPNPDLLVVPADFDAVPEWGLGDPRAGTGGAVHRLALPPATSVDPAGWLAALGVVLSRYEPVEQSVVAAVGVDGCDAVALLPVESTGEFADQLGCASTSRVTAGMVFDLDEQGELARLGDYIPCLAPIFPLTITLERGVGGSPCLRLDHRLRAVGPEIAGQFARHLVEAHRQVAGPPERAAAHVDLYDDAERERVLALGHSERSVVAPPRRIQDVFADRVAERPAATAVSHEDSRVTYRELDEWSDRFAHGLRAVGVRDGDTVGLCLERSAELVALVLAVLKAGAVYVPLDPAHPSDRLAYTVADSGVDVLISGRAEFPGHSQGRIVTPTHLADLGAAASGPPSTATTPADPAYVIYTSGSTGRPKGVVVPHANVISLVDAADAEFGLRPDDVWTVFHSIAFDFSVWEIWGCLLTGGCLVVVPYWVSRSPEQFRDLLIARSVTVLSQTPSAFVQLLAVDRGFAPELAVRLVVFGGEPLATRRLLPWLDRYPESRCRLVNMFGITETTVHVTAETVDRKLALAASRSVGRVLAGWHVYVLDDAGRPTPPGVAGEIHVGGAGVASGYLGRPELTAARFLPDPFHGGRMYRSGDRGRLLPDGRLEHLGRIDNQIKLRGFRIELDEIRTVLGEAPGVVDAAVVQRQDDPDDPATARIDAYVVLTEGSTAQVRQHVARLLPDYALPATITALPTLPLTGNGKLDVANLPAQQRKPQDAHEPPGEDGIRDGLLDVWRQVLGAPVGMDDDWFELGGNSLFAVRMAAAMRERGLPSPHPRTLYLNPTVRRLADALRSPAGPR